MSATATARRAVPICRTHRRKGSPSGVPCALCRVPRGVPSCRTVTGSDTVRRSDLPRRTGDGLPWRSRSAATVCRAARGDLAGRSAMSRTGQQAATVRRPDLPTGTGTGSDTVRRTGSDTIAGNGAARVRRGVPVRRTVRARSDLPPRPCALCRPFCGVIFQGVSSPIKAHQTTSNNHGIISGQSRGRFGACPRFKAFQALSRFIKHHQTMKRAKSRHCVPICRTGSRRTGDGSPWQPCGRSADRRGRSGLPLLYLELSRTDSCEKPDGAGYSFAIVRHNPA